MMRPVERQEIPARPPLTEKVQPGRQSDPDAKRRFAQQLRESASKRQGRAEEPASDDQVIIGEEPETESGESEERGAREEQDARDATIDDQRAEGGIDIKV